MLQTPGTGQCRLTDLNGFFDRQTIPRPPNTQNEDLPEGGRRLPGIERGAFFAAQILLGR
jgi:hypothetical protein